MKNTTSKLISPLSHHITLDFYGCEIPNIELISNIFLQASKKANAELLEIKLHPFAGGGYTGVALLSESHMSIHTWPELDYVAIDIFMCGDANSYKASEFIKESIAHDTLKENVVIRGDLIL